MTHEVGAEAGSEAEVHHGVRGLGLDEASPSLERRGQRPRNNRPEVHLINKSDCRHNFQKQEIILKNYNIQNWKL